MTVLANAQKRNPKLERRIVIVGGGLSGLSTAFFLSLRAAKEHLALKITVLEASDRFGGVLRTLSHEGVRMEAGADAFYAGQNDATDLCRELGLQDDLIEAAPCFRRFFRLKEKKLFPVPVTPDSCLNVVRFLSDPGVSFSTKLRMLKEPFIPRRREAGDESLASFIRRRLGEGFYQEVVDPVVRSVYMTDPERLSLGATFPRLQQAERTYGSLGRSFLYKKIGKNEKGNAEFLTLRQGLEGLVRALLRGAGKCEFRISSPVRQCAYRESVGWEISLEDGASLCAEGLYLAMNACDISRLLSGSAPGLSRALSSIRYDSIAAVNLIYKAGEVMVRGRVPGFLVPRADAPCSFSSLKWLGRSADGKHLLLRAFLSEAMIPGIYSESEETLKKKIPAFLNDFLGFQAQPLFIDVRRYPNALPQYEVGHLERVAWIEEKVRQYPGLFLTGNGFRGFGITDCIRQARIAASTLQLSSF